jgi:hypothetical protein
MKIYLWKQENISDIKRTIFDEGIKMDWINILKVKQIITPVTDVNIKKIPKKKEPDDKCCKEAWRFYLYLMREHDVGHAEDALERANMLIESMTIQGFNNPEWGGCRALRRALREHEPDGAYKEIMTNVLEEWKKCERGEANAFAEMW